MAVCIGADLIIASQSASDLWGKGRGDLERQGKTKGVDMENVRSYDAIVIGTGQGGKPLSMALAEAGLKTAVVEKWQVGGSCINYG